MNLNDFKRGYHAGSDAYQEKVGQWSYWVVFFLVLALTEATSRRFGLTWYASLGVMVLFVFLLLGLVLVSKRFFWKSPSE
jgi:L-asparagine transporter-like permease